MPRLAHADGEMASKKAPTLKDSPLPVKSISRAWVSGKGGLRLRSHASVFHVHAPTTNSSDVMLYVAYMVTSVDAACAFESEF